MDCRKLVASILFSFCAVAAQGATLPETGANVHEGVASCATSVCHGKVAADPNSPVLLNEYRTWSRKDDHAQSYQTLLNAQSKSIAKKMGLPGAHTAKVCLDCHSDNPPEDARGRRFYVNEGVGCEGCHGGGGQWLESHAEQGTSHADNLAKGMYPTEQPIERARLCLSCHLGTENKFATHEIMGAGHPRLAFELEVFTVNQPRHYETDADYRERKPYIASVNMWLAGLVVTGQKTMELLQEDWFTQNTLMPELSFYQCHACHHPMDKLRWSPEGGAAALPPGAVRLNDASLVLLQAVLEILGNNAATSLQSGLNKLHTASMQDRSAVTAQAASLRQMLGELETSLVAANYGAQEMRSLRLGLLDRSAAGKFRHFTVAEQAFFAVETLSIELKDNERLSGSLDGWFKTVEDENDFIPQQFAGFAKKFRGAL